MTKQLTIPGKFNGPPNSGNGGYSCGVLGKLIPGAARVRLHSPPPLDRALTVLSKDESSVSLLDGEKLVGVAQASSLDLEVPAAPTLAQARAAAARYIGREGHSFPTCYVCGTERPERDGLELFTGPVGSTNMVASPWAPTQDMLDTDAHIRPEILWAALDCPGYFAVMGAHLRPCLLGELTAEIVDGAPGAGDLVVYAWPIAQDGRKHFAGSAIADGSGRLLAYAKATWIEIKSSAAD